MSPALQPGPFGWLDLPKRYTVAASMPWPVFSQAAPHLMGRAVPDNILLYRAWKDVLGTYPPYKAQTIGDCVSHGAGHALDLLACIEIAIGKEPEEYKEACTEAIYGISREIAGLLHSGDGSFGSAGAKAMTDFGVLPREAVGEYSGRRAKEWGSGRGVPADIKAKCKEHQLGAASMMKTCDELDAGLANGYTGTVASNQGFTMTRDSTGLCRPSGSWAHQMCIVGRRLRDGKREYLIAQSWGSNVPDGPLVDDQPDFTFWADERTVGRMLGQGDSFFLSKFNGYPGRPLPSSWVNSDWF